MLAISLGGAAVALPMLEEVSRSPPLSLVSFSWGIFPTQARPRPVYVRSRDPEWHDWFSLTVYMPLQLASELAEKDFFFNGAVYPRYRATVFPLSLTEKSKRA
jgi:hypothetical protein